MKEGLRKTEKINAMVGVTRELQEQLCCLNLQLDQRQADLERADLEQWLLLREFCGGEVKHATVANTMRRRDISPDMQSRTAAAETNTKQRDERRSRRRQLR
jgi:hypothetical protein